MSDDIVTRPEQEIDFVEYLRLWASPDANDQAVKDLHKAADEIERLRELVVLCPKCYETEHGIGRWEKEVRGE